MNQHLAVVESLKALIAVSPEGAEARLLDLGSSRDDQSLAEIVSLLTSQELGALAHVGDGTKPSLALSLAEPERAVEAVLASTPWWLPTDGSSRAVDVSFRGAFPLLEGLILTADAQRQARLVRALLSNEQGKLIIVLAILPCALMVYHDEEPVAGSREHLFQVIYRVASQELLDLLEQYVEVDMGETYICLAALEDRKMGKLIAALRSHWPQVQSFSPTVNSVEDDMFVSLA